MKKKNRNIDNTAKIFSLDFVKNANIFRFSIILKEKIDKNTLEIALKRSLKSHASFKVKLKRGLFWDYFGYNNKNPIVEESNSELKHFAYNKNNDYLFKVTYNNKTINVDFFHLLTDGIGAISFIKSIASNYLDIKKNTNYNLNEKKYKLSYQDEFLKNYDKNAKGNLSLKNIYLFKEKRKKEINNTYHYTVNINDIKNASKKYSATITEYITALYIYSIYLSMYDKKTKKEIALTIPIDIRKYYQVDTLSNFFVCMKVNPKIFEKNLSSFEEILSSIKLEFKNNITSNKIKQYLAKEVRLGQNLGYKYVPSFIKKFFMGYFGKYFGTSTTSTLSNLGLIDIDDRYKKYIDNFYAIVMPGRLQKIKCTICSFDKKFNITINSNIDDIKFERQFYKLLNKDIKKITTNNNNNVKF